MRVEGVNYEIDWRAFRKGMSIFIPCLHPPRAREEVMAVAKRLRVKLLIKVIIEDGIRGLRIWRM